MSPCFKKRHLFSFHKKTAVRDAREHLSEVLLQIPPCGDGGLLFLCCEGASLLVSYAAGRDVVLLLEKCIEMQGGEQQRQSAQHRNAYMRKRWRRDTPDGARAETTAVAETEHGAARGTAPPHHTLCCSLSQRT